MPDPCSECTEDIIILVIKTSAKVHYTKGTTEKGNESRYRPKFLAIPKTKFGLLCHRFNEHLGYHSRYKLSHLLDCIRKQLHLFYLDGLVWLLSQYLR